MGAIAQAIALLRGCMKQDSLYMSPESCFMVAVSSADLNQAGNQARHGRQKPLKLVVRALFCNTNDPEMRPPRYCTTM